ncbi:putative serine/threonine-protein kinase WNK8 [Gossypium arboreum]|uniref:Putative serine/threonine-protein kinase WNK8 n=1 Tax=Gossypium arboreum TaxID=29729 RepID=A0A0B0MFM3_GOSAR|nr:putative serine/threonine-protein kinase WNK8 [Gossypium arboreum]
MIFTVEGFPIPHSNNAWRRYMYYPPCPISKSTQDIELVNQAILKSTQDNRTTETMMITSSPHCSLRMMIMMLIKQIQKSENGSGSGGIVVEELVKELKAITKQNTITHCLLSAMIVVTLFWQVFEASLLQLKNGFTHPFKSVGSWLVTLLKGPAKSKQHYSYLVDASGSPPSLQVVKITGIADNGGDVRLKVVEISFGFKNSFF